MSVRDMCSGAEQLVPAELRGYRMWRNSGRFLTATNALHGEWVRPDLHATCRRSALAAADPEHRSPVEGCGCGIYGWYRPDETRIHRGSVFGAIAASGRLLLGDYGFRAERARIVALVEPDDSDARADDFARYWRARGVAVFTSREELVAAFPPDDVRELLGREMPPMSPFVVWPSQAAWLGAGVQPPMPGTTAAALAELGKAVEELRRQAIAEAERFAKRLEQVQRVAASVGTSMAELRAVIMRHVGHVERAAGIPDEQWRRALEHRRRGHRGPEKRRRGRARLSL